MLWPASRFEAIEQYIRDSLDEMQRFALKVSSPLGVGDVLARRYGSMAAERLALLTSDRDAIEDIERQLAQYRGDLARGFELRMIGRRESAARDGSARPRLLR